MTIRLTMFYYIYILTGPLKNTILPLVSTHYFISLYNNKTKEINDKKATLYIPCNKEIEERTLSITLDPINIKNNKVKIENSVHQHEIDTEFSLEIEKPFYLNDNPIFLISRNNNLAISNIDLKKKRNSITMKKILLTVLIFIITLSISLFYFIKSPSEKKLNKPVIKSLNFKGYQGNNGYDCIYDKLFLESKNSDNKKVYIDLNNVNNTLSKNNKITNIVLNEKQKPIIKFIYHNELEKLKITEEINKNFTLDCQPMINPLSLSKIIEDINNFSFSNKVSYIIKEKKNGIVFVFDDKLSQESKLILDDYIKKQTTNFGRKFISYHESISVPNLGNKTTLQEDKGYIFINNQHRYFPQG